MVTDAVGLGCSPTITSDSAGLVITCWSAGCNALGLCAFSDVRSLFYWSSSSSVSDPSDAWILTLSNGFSQTASKTDFSLFAWPVRGGQ